MNSQPTIDEAVLLYKAVERAYEAQQEYYRIQDYKDEKGIKPIEPAAMAKMEGMSVDYWLAVLKAAENTNSTNTLAPFSRDTRKDDRLSPIYDVFGVETANALFSNPSGVTNSQIHYGENQGVFIESQPLHRGEIVGLVRDNLLEPVHDLMG
jgi:hypothetical protein